jgi:hypothetical protein
MPLKIYVTVYKTTLRPDHLLRHLFPEWFSAALLKTGTAVSTSGTAADCCPPPPHFRSVDAMDLEEKIYKKKHHHQYWVHPLLCTRLEMGQFNTLFYELWKDESEFFKYFRTSLKSSDEMLNLQQGNPKWPAAALIHF